MNNYKFINVELYTNFNITNLIADMVLGRKHQNIKGKEDLYIK